jgi:hypothetical protein
MNNARYSTGTKKEEDPALCFVVLRGQRVSPTASGARAVRFYYFHVDTNCPSSALEALAKISDFLPH